MEEICHAPCPDAPLQNSFHPKILPAKNDTAYGATEIGFPNPHGTAANPDFKLTLKRHS